MIYAEMYLVMERSERHIALETLKQCTRDVMTWMENNKLACNTLKTEVVLFSSRYLRHDPISQVSVRRLTNLAIITSIRDFGVCLDHYLMSSHVNRLCKSASFSIKRIGQICKYLDALCTETLVHAFVTSKLDYCNSLLIGLPDKEISKLQRIQNAAARFVTRTRKTDHISPILRKLHWLPVHKRIIFKSTSNHIQSFEWTWAKIPS